jgi:hypothetical protein
MGIYSGDGMRGEGGGGGNIPIVQGWRLYRRSTTVRARRAGPSLRQECFCFLSQEVRPITTIMYEYHSKRKLASVSFEAKKIHGFWIFLIFKGGPLHKTGRFCRKYCSFHINIKADAAAGNCKDDLKIQNAKKTTRVVIEAR